VAHAPWSLARRSVDGADPQRRDIEAAIALHQSDTVIIHDFVHALEYLRKAAHCLYESGSSQAEDWVQKHAVALPVCSLAQGTSPASDPIANVTLGRCHDSSAERSTFASGLPLRSKTSTRGASMPSDGLFGNFKRQKLVTLFECFDNLF
jgi:hypothetical protein